MAGVVQVISTSIIKQCRIVKARFMGLYDIRTPKEASPAGLDSCPIEDSRAIYIETSKKGSYAIIGYLTTEKIAEVGETRLFSTDETGALKMWLHLKNDGIAEFGGNTKHLTRFEELQSGFNTLKTDFNNLVTLYNSHIHPTPSGASSPTVSVGTQSAADISGAKINEIKTL